MSSVCPRTASALCPVSASAPSLQKQITPSVSVSTSAAGDGPPGVTDSGTWVMPPILAAARRVGLGASAPDPSRRRVSAVVARAYVFAVTDSTEDCLRYRDANPSRGSVQRDREVGRAA